MRNSTVISGWWAIPLMMMVLSALLPAAKAATAVPAMEAWSRRPEHRQDPRGASLAGSRSYLLTPALRARQLESCAQTYGAGSETCGGEGSAFCYNPVQGQSCCPKDHGFCGAGTYCAPVAGFCCQNGESVAVCAQTAGFQLPASAGNGSNSTDVQSSAEPTTTVVEIIGSTTISAPAPTGPGPNLSSPTGNEPWPVQVAMARRDKPAVEWWLTGLGLGALGFLIL